MQIFNSEQGTEQWHIDRAGAATCSNFSMVRERLKSGPNKGDFTTAAHNYAFRLAFERVVNTPLDDTFRTVYMDRGNTLEDEARMLYSIERAEYVEEVGFIRFRQDFGYSPDGLVGDDGLIEIKAFVAPDVLMPIFLRGDFQVVMDQVQGGMWITGRQWCDFVLYIPSLATKGHELTIRRIYRDDKYISGLEADLREFNGLVEQYKEEFLHSLQKGEEPTRTTQLRI